MSIEAVAWALKLRHPNAIHKIVLIGVADHANPATTQGPPDMETLELFTGLGRHEIVIALNEMRQEGFLMIPSGLNIVFPNT